MDYKSKHYVYPIYHSRESPVKKIIIATETIKKDLCILCL